MGRVAKLTVQGHTYLQNVLEQELESKFLTLCSELFCLHSASFFKKLYFGLNYSECI